MGGIPVADYPTCWRGKMLGPVRFESLEGREWVEGGKDIRVRLREVEPFPANRKPGLPPEIFAVTHLQKYSSWGWLWMRPFCFHFWWFWKKQAKDVRGNWIPGTERGVYVRSPGWRWDPKGTPVDGKLAHWIRTKGYVGGHWD